MTIPASRIVQVQSNVLAATGNAPVLNGVFLSQNSIVPNNSVLSFLNAQDVGSYFGLGSQEYDLANRVYFNGYNNGILRPGALIISKYNSSNSPSFLQSNFLTISLQTLQTFTGRFTIEVDGISIDTGVLDFSLVTSFSQAASLIETAINNPVNIVTVDWNPDNKTFIITTLSTGITSTLTYATDVGLSTLAKDLLLTMDTGSTLSQGADTDTPATAIQRLVAYNTAWFSVTTLFEPSQNDKIAFASVISPLDKYLYVCWDSDPETIISNSILTTSYLIRAAQYNNVFLISGSSQDAINEGSTLSKLILDTAVFVQGFSASIDFSQVNGRTTAAFRSLSGLLPTVTTASYADNLLQNGYNFYGNYANSTNDWLFLYDGNVTGKYKWLDSFYGAVYLTQQMQTQEMELLVSSSSIPYNPDGYASIRVSLNSVINNALNFGTIRTGVILDNNQISVVNSQAGLDISRNLQTNGWYLQVLDPGTIARQNRQSPIINFWYMDGQSVQKIFIDAIDIL